MRFILIVVLLLWGCLEKRHIEICDESCKGNAGFVVEFKSNSLKCECLGNIEKVYEK